MDSWLPQQQQQQLLPSSSNSDLCAEMFPIISLIADPISFSSETEPNYYGYYRSIIASNSASASGHGNGSTSDQLEPQFTDLMSESHPILDADCTNFDFNLLNNSSINHRFSGSESLFAFPSDSASTVISTSSAAAAASVTTLAPAAVNQTQVRKLSQRITALQQLVSPFGKTDTASVLSEAIGYIKFLQEQVHVLSSPYMILSSNADGKECESGSDLRSRGLCLVPISCTENVATNSNGADYWISGSCNHH